MANGSPLQRQDYTGQSSITYLVPLILSFSLNLYSRQGAIPFVTTAVQDAIEQNNYSRHSQEKIWLRAYGVQRWTVMFSKIISERYWYDIEVKP